MKTPTLSVTTEHGTFIRSTWNAYTVIAVLKTPNCDEPWAIWSRDVDKARKSVARFGWGEVLGFYSVETGKKIAPGFKCLPKGQRAAAKAAPKPVVVQEFEKCGECDRRHDPARLRCGNCWRCHEPSVKCKVTKSEVQASIERHNAAPEFYRVLTQTWRSFEEVTVPQCECHGK